MIPIRLWSVVVSQPSQPRGLDRGPCRAISGRAATGAVRASTSRPPWTSRRRRGRTMVRAGWRPGPRRQAEAHHVSRHALTLRAAPSRRDGRRPYSASGANVARPEWRESPALRSSLALKPVVPARPTGRHRQPPDGSVLVRASTAGAPAHDSPRPTRIEPAPDARQDVAAPRSPASTPSSMRSAAGACDCGRYRRRSPPGAQRPQRVRPCARAGDTCPFAGLPAGAGRTLNRVALIGGFAASGRLPFRIGLVTLREGGADRDRKYDDRDDQVQQSEPKYPTRARQAQQRDGPDDQSEADRADDQQSWVAGCLRRSEGVEDGIASHRDLPKSGTRSPPMLAGQGARSHGYKRPSQPGPRRDRADTHPCRPRRGRVSPPTSRRTPHGGIWTFVPMVARDPGRDDQVMTSTDHIDRPPSADRGGRLLICYDGSAHAKHAIRHAARLLSAKDALVVTVWQPTRVAWRLCLGGRGQHGKWGRPGSRSRRGGRPLGGRRRPYRAGCRPRRRADGRRGRRSRLEGPLPRPPTAMTRL